MIILPSCASSRWLFFSRELYTFRRRQPQIDDINDALDAGCVACFRSLLAFPWSKIDFARSASHSLSSNLLGSIQRNQLDNENSTDRDCLTCHSMRIYVSASPSTTTSRVPKLTFRMDRLASTRIELETTVVSNFILLLVLHNQRRVYFQYLLKAWQNNDPFGFYIILNLYAVP